jgi:hypothetical protein
MDHPLYSEIVGVASAAASLYAANSRTIIPLRIAAIAANALAMIYSGLHGTYPTFALNAILLPLNAWRLYGMHKLIRDIEAAAATDMNAQWLLPYMRPIAFKAGDIVMRRGDLARDAFYIVSGEVEVVEFAKVSGAGTLLGEIGLFTPDGLRTATVRARTDVQAAHIDYERFRQLYFQNPEFGFRLLRLIVGRMQEGHGLPKPLPAAQ